MEELNSVISYIANLSLKEFGNQIASQSIVDDRGFIGGKYIDDCLDRLESNHKLIEITARDHFKSTRLYFYIMWQIMTSKEDLEIQYFSFNATMSAYHTEKLQGFISNNFWFQYLEQAGALINNSPNAKTFIDYTNPFNAKITINSQAVKGFTRGIHCNVLILDDVFPDIQARHKSDPTEVLNVNHIVRASLLSMVKDGGKIIVVGTPQTPSDFFYDEALKDQFKITSQPAIVNDKNKQVLWEEWMDYEELMKRKEALGERLFNQEYMASPAYVENSFIKPEYLQRAIRVKQVNDYTGDANVYAGYDIGKKTHPSHIAIFKEVKGVYTQLASYWMDKWDYTKQIEFY